MNEVQIETKKKKKSDWNNGKSMGPRVTRMKIALLYVEAWFTEINFLHAKRTLNGGWFCLKVP